MPKPVEIACSLADTLAETDDVRSEIVALGMVASGVILHAPIAQRAELVEMFCRVLRTSVATELHS